MNRNSPWRWPLLLLAVATLAAPGPSRADWPEWAERLMFNPEERTRRALEAYRQGESAQPEAEAATEEDAEVDPATGEPLVPLQPAPEGDGEGLVGDPEQAREALDPLETALRLAPETDVAQFNAGTARLGSGSGDARSLLEAAAESRNDVLASSANFNLGNSHFAEGALEEAIDAYRQSLRRNPDNANAKYNLELAQRRLEEQQQEQQDQQQDPNQQNQDQQDQQNQDQQDQQDQDQDQDQQNQDQQNQDQQNQDQQDQDQQNQDQQNQDQQNQDQQNQDQQNQDQRDQDQQNQDQQNQDQQNQDQQDPQDPQNPNQGPQEKPLPQFEDLPDMTAEEAAAILEAIENMEREALQQEALEAARKNADGKKDW